MERGLLKIGIQTNKEAGDGITNELSNNTGTSRSKKKRVKGKSNKLVNKLTKNTTNAFHVEEVNVDRKSSKSKSKIERYYDELGLNEILNQSEEEIEEVPCPVPTKSDPGVEVVVFEDQWKKRKRAGYSKPVEKDEEEPEVEQFTMKKVRYDVYKFGIKGFNEKDKRTAREELLVGLGAKPRKQKPINYKDKMVEVKLSKQKEIEERERNQKGVQMVVLPANHKKESKQKRRPTIDYQVGKFKNGVQYVDKKMIKFKK